MKVSFYARTDTNSDRPAGIIATVCFDGKRLRLSSGVSILPKQWDRKKERAKRGSINEATINRRLDMFAATILKEYTRLINEERAVTPELLKERLRKPSTEARAVPPLLEAYKTFLTVESSNARLTKGTLMVYETVKKHLEGFESTFGLSLTWDSLNALFFQKFIEYLLRVAGLNNVTLWKYIQILRAFLRHVEERQGIPVCPDYKKFSKVKVVPKGEQSKKPYLTPEELLRLEELDLRHNDRLRKTRDLFLFSCYVGPRYGDGQGLRRDSLKGEFFEVVTGKNRKAIRIPVHPTARRIWNMYEGVLPKITNQPFNRYIKEVCQLAKIDESTVVVDQKGAQQVRKPSVPKYELMSTHTAKRTFVTLLLLQDIPIPIICEVTGNTSDTIERYMLPTSEDARRRIMEAWKKE